MGYYKLYRQAPQGKAIHGTLYYCVDLSSPFVWKELTGISGVSSPLCGRGGGGEALIRAASTLENVQYAIPALIYRVAVTMSPRFGKLLPILYNVPNRTGIRIHGGIKPEHSRGCILLNRKAEYKAVVERLLYEQSRNEEIRIEIIDFKPGDPAEPENVIPLNYTSYEKIPTEEGFAPAA